MDGLQGVHIQRTGPFVQPHQGEAQLPVHNEGRVQGPIDVEGQIPLGNYAIHTGHLAAVQGLLAEGEGTDLGGNCDRESI